MTLKNISLQSDERLLFENINCNIKHKEQLAIIGPNGAGKSSLLKIAAGLILPTSGHVELYHEAMTTLKGFEKYRENIGYLFQDSDDQFLAPTVLEDVAFGLRNRGVAKEEAKKIALEKLEELGIAHLHDKVPMRLSGGEKRLVAIAGVLVTNPAILLLDEPSNGLDDSTKAKVVEILNSLDASTIIVSHEKEFIESLNTKVMELRCDGLYQLA